MMAEAAAGASPAHSLPPAPPAPNDPPMPLYIPTRMGLDLGPPVYIYGSRTTHCDIQCTTNTTKARHTPAAPLDPSAAPHTCILPYEVANLLQLAEPHLNDTSITSHRTPLELQQMTNFRVRKNRLFKRERRSFLRRLAMARHDRFCLESLACIRIQAVFRGYRSRLHLQARRLGLTEEDLEARRAVYHRRRREDARPRTRVSQAEAERAMFEAVVDEIRAASAFLGLPPIEGYTLPPLSPAKTTCTTMRRHHHHHHHHHHHRDVRRADMENAAATVINKMVRGYLARKRVDAIKKERLNKHDYDLCVRVQSRWRGYRIRRDNWKVIELTFRGAAIKIQSVFRGYRARKHVALLRRLKSFEKRQALAAKRIQSRVKGFVSKRVNEETTVLGDDGGESSSSNMKRIQSMPPSRGVGRDLSDRKIRSSQNMTAIDTTTSNNKSAMKELLKREESLDEEEAVSLSLTTTLSADVLSTQPPAG